ncbi:MAG: VOC family protein [Desulfomonilaceae bacterium]|nr:VOC family protein [Desulfomonilaceae bacterium]
MIKRIYGFNIAVQDLDQAVPKFETLLGVKSRPLQASDFAFPGMKGATLDVNGVSITLITSTDDNSPAGRFLKSKGEGIMLIALESDDVDSDSEKVRSQGLALAAPKTMKGGWGKANWIHPKSLHGVQVEIFFPGGVYKKS